MAATGAAGAAGAVTHSAGGVHPAHDRPIYHPDRDHMGSEIAKHSTKTPYALPAAASTQMRGLDVSRYQGNVDWKTVAGIGGKFAYVKATEANDYRNPYFAQQYLGSYHAGLMHGAYHFALPNRTGPVTQARYFIAHGGGWSKDGKTLPPMLDIEYNPYGSTCYGMSQQHMVAWIWGFMVEVQKRTHRFPTIYSNLDWWSRCTGNTAAFTRYDPLFVARYSSSPGALPGHWGFYTFWQFASAGRFPGDQDVFNGSLTRLQALARG